MDVGTDSKWVVRLLQRLYSFVDLRRTVPSFNLYLYIFSVWICPMKIPPYLVTISSKFQVVPLLVE